ncbi:protein kinase family protein [Anaeromyxobacter oryzisoli]|uniref:hypothetical protein n=1 Tax=Anaeromyxobacter oryzisoli TaxID=2925408 RepID=UPI001F59ED2C|nr:hypothetical protein [Anaeromyxobacter sp. SG63]
MAETICPDHDLVAPLAGGRSSLVRDRGTGRLAVLRRVALPGPALTRRLRALERAGGVLHGPFVPIDRPGAALVLRPFAPGRPLAEVLAAPPAPGEALALAGAVARAVAALHARGVAHGALHPGNVIVGAAGAVALVDGVDPLRLPPDPGDPGAPSAVACAAPEVLRGGRASARADAFSLAVLVHALLAGRLPLRTDDALETLRRALFEAPAPLAVVRPDLPTALGAALARALDRRPRRRDDARARARGCAGARAHDGRAATSPGSGSSARPLRRARSAVPAGTASPAPAVEREVDGRPPSPPTTPRTSAPPAAPPERRPREARTKSKGNVAARLAVAARRALLVAAPVAGAALLCFPLREPAFARDVSALLAAGDLPRARAALEAAARRHPRDPYVEKLRGDLACARGDGGECLRRYRAALEARAAFRSDPLLRANALRLLAREDHRLALVRVAARLDGIDDALAERTRDGRYWVRWNAVRALEARGEAGRIDYALVYVKDLQRGSSCETKRAAASKLAELRDPRALPALEEARRAGGLLGFLCTGDALDRAIAGTRGATRSR